MNYLVVFNDGSSSVICNVGQVLFEGKSIRFVRDNDVVLDLWGISSISVLPKMVF